MPLPESSSSSSSSSSSIFRPFSRTRTKEAIVIFRTRCKRSLLSEGPLHQLRRALATLARAGRDCLDITDVTIIIKIVDDAVAHGTNDRGLENLGAGKNSPLEKQFL